METVIDHEITGESQVKEIQFVRVDNEFYAVYLVGHCEIKRELLGYRYAPSYNTFTALRREWRIQCQPP